jgi:hypothetical protein
VTVETAAPEAAPVKVRRQGVSVRRALQPLRASWPEQNWTAPSGQQAGMEVPKLSSSTDLGA